MVTQALAWVGMLIPALPRHKYHDAGIGIPAYVRLRAGAADAFGGV
jgi:hypothetical protein